MPIIKKSKFESKSIKYNVIMNIILNFSNLVFPLISFPYITRVLTVENIGKINFYNTIGTYAVMLAGIGISTYGVRACSLRRNNKDILSRCVQELFLIKSVSTFFVVICLLSLFYFVRPLNQEPLLFLIECIYIIVSIFNLDWFFSGIEQYSYITKRAIFIRTLSIVALFIFVKEKNDYIIYALLTILSSVISTIVNLVYANKFISYKRQREEYYNIKQHIRPSITLFGAILAVSIYTSLDTIMLGIICGDIDVGFYAVAVKIKSVLLTLINSISTVLLPRLSYYVEQKLEDQYQLILNKSILVITLISLALTAFFMIEADNAILILSGKSYLPATKGMIILMPILLISGFSNIIGNQVLLPHEMDKCFTVAVSIGAITDFMLNIFLMPYFGFVGAAFATFVAEIVQASIQSFFARKYLKSSIDLSEIVKIFIVTLAVSYIVASLKKIINISLIADFTVMWLVYFALYICGLFIFKSSTLIYLFGIIKKTLKNIGNK